jgi:hypothetical protein
MEISPRLQKPRDDTIKEIDSRVLMVGVPEQPLQERAPGTDAVVITVIAAKIGE